MFTRDRSRTLRFCRGLIALAGHLVPGHERHDWQREWDAELWHRLAALEDRGQLTFAQRTDVIIRCLGALWHAVWLRKREWSVSMVVQDIRYAARGLRKRPGFTLVAVITLALGIGANTAIFSLVNGVLLEPLPFEEPGQLVRIYDTNLERGVTSTPSSPANFLDWREDQQVFSDIAGFTLDQETLTEVQPAEAITGANVSAEMFRVLGVMPIRGRPFTRDEETPGNDRVVIVSHGFWERYLGGDPGVTSRNLSLNGEPYRIVGVMPPGFAFPTEDTRLWLPLAFHFDVSTSRGVHFVHVLGRLKPGTSLGLARSGMTALAAQMEAAYPDKLTGWGVRLVSLHEAVVGSVRTRILVLFGAVGLVLLITCANVVNLLLARAMSRSREIAVRIALGAGKTRLMRQLLSESILLAILGGAVSLVVAYGALNALLALDPGGIPRLDNVGLDGIAFAFAFGLSLIAGAAVGLLPSIRASRTNLHESLKEGGRSSSSGVVRSRVRSALVIAEIALALVLASGAGLLIRSFAGLQQVDSGFKSEGVVAMSVSLPRNRYPEDRDKSRFFGTLVERAGSLPGVVSAGVVTQLPLNGWAINFGFDIEGEPDPGPNEGPEGDFFVISPGYFRTMEIPLLRGRAFTASDVAESARVIIINRSLAERYFPDRDPIGERLLVSYGDGVAAEIVGVVSDVKQRALNVPPAPGYYLPVTQVAWSTMYIALRTKIEAGALVRAVREEVAALDPELSVTDVRTLEERVSASVASPRFNMFLFSAFAAVALVLAAVGVYGVMSYLVTQRTQEIGVRMALGASAAAVRRSISLQGLRLAGIGVALGLLAAFGLTRLLSSLLFGVTATDPLTFIGVSLILGAAAWLGSYVPAYRASGVDPTDALRAE